MSYCLPSQRHVCLQLPLVFDPEGEDRFCTGRNLQIFRRVDPVALSYYGQNQPPPDRLDLTPKEERKLFRQFAKRKTKRVREALVRRYLCWAFGVAAKYKGPRLEFDEAIGVANLGLMEALSGFRPSLGYRFTTYAFFVVRRRLIEAIVNTYPVRVSDHLRKSLRALTISPEEQMRDIAHDEEPRTLEEFFDRLGDCKDVLVIGDLHERREDAPCAPAPAPDPVARLDEQDLSARLQQALASLPELEREVVLARHYRDAAESVSELSKRLNVSKAAIQAAEQEALRRLREHLKQTEE